MRSWRALATDTVDGNDKRLCTWLATPPTARAFILFSLAIPPSPAPKRWVTDGEDQQSFEGRQRLQ